MGLGIPTRGELDQDGIFRLRTPDALRDRGLEELTGTKGIGVAFVNGSKLEVCDETEFDSDISIEVDGIVGIIT